MERDKRGACGGKGGSGGERVVKSEGEGGE